MQLFFLVSSNILFSLFSIDKLNELTDK